MSAMVKRERVMRLMLCLQDFAALTVPMPVFFSSRIDPDHIQLVANPYVRAVLSRDLRGILQALDQSGAHQERFVNRRFVRATAHLATAGWGTSEADK
jgi:hypothetical protein